MPGELGASVGINAGSWQISLFAKKSPADNFVAEGYTPMPRVIGIAGDLRF
jgi:hypothetical protein